MRRRTLARLVCMLFLGFCLFPLTVYGAGGAIQDAVGDWVPGVSTTGGNSYTDITKVQFVLNKTIMTVTFTLVNDVPSTPPSERLDYWIAIDSDQNPTTGRTDKPSVFNGIGVDYEVAVLYDADHSSWLYIVWNHTLWPTYSSRYSAGSYLISGNRVKFSFPLSEVASPTNFNFVFATSEHGIFPLIDAVDHAPNTGFITFGK